MNIFRVFTFSSFFLLLSACGVIQVVNGALFYPVNLKNQANQVVVSNRGVAYFSLAEAGIGITDIKNKKRIGTIALPSPMSRVDVLAIDNDILFALDVSNGLLSSFSVASPRRPVLISAPITVSTQDRFNDLSARNGVLVVSGGVSRTLAICDYDNQGKLSNLRTSEGYAYGHPKVEVHSSGRTAYIAFHELISNFGFSVLSLKPSIQEKKRITLQGANFTQGGSRFGNFPINMKVINTNILVVAYAKKVDFFDISNSLSPLYIRTIKLNFNAIGLDASDSHIAVVGSYPKPSISIIDVHSIKTARIIKQIDLAPKSLPSSVAIFGNYFIIAARQLELIIVRK